MLNFEDHWYRPHPSFLVKTLLPLSWLYQLIVKFRRFLYQIKLIKSIRFNILIIVVGNITVGGTGKTPLVIWLAHFLKAHGFKPGIVSRGVGGEQQYAPRWVSEKMSPKLVGDEAILLARRSLCPVVIGINRVAAVNFLLEKSDCDIVLSDDGLQHYRLGRQIEVAILDGERGLGNKKFLPAGPLRESPQRLDEVDFLVTHGKANSAKFSMKLKCEKLVSLKNEDQMHTFDYFQHKTIHGVAAIGNPQRFFNNLSPKSLLTSALTGKYQKRSSAKSLHLTASFSVMMIGKLSPKLKSSSE